MKTIIYIVTMLVALLSMPIAAHALVADNGVKADGTLIEKDDYSRWKWPSNNVHVCWENPPGEWTVEKEWVREAILTSWIQYSDLSAHFIEDISCDEIYTEWHADFFGEGATQPLKWKRLCGPRPQGEDCYCGKPKADGICRYLNLQELQLLRIRLNSKLFDTQTSSALEGWLVFGNRDGVRINMLQCSGRKDCIQHHARHEFGHALGFGHEHQRSDAEGNCADGHQKNPGDGDKDLENEAKLTTEYDSKSVMNYCRSFPNEYAGLTTLDIEGLQFVYGDGGNPVDGRPEFANAKYVGKFLGCPDRFPANNNFEKSFLHALTDQCFSCPKGKKRTANPDVNSKNACHVKLFVKPSRATLRGRPGCSNTPVKGYNRGFQHGLGGHCYACPVGYKRTGRPFIGDLAKFDKACRLEGRFR